MRQALNAFLNSIIHTLTMQDADESLHALYRLNLLKIIIYGNLIAVLAILVFAIVTTDRPRTFFASVVLGVLITICNILALRIVEQGNVRLVSRVIVGGGFIVLAILAYGSGGLYSSIMMTLVGLLITGTLLLDLKARLVLYLAMIVLVITLFQIEVSENLPDAPFKDLPYRIFILSSVYTSIFLIINYHLYASRQTEKRIRALQVNDERHTVQRQLTQDLAHDLRTPLTSMHTTAYLIRKRIEMGLSTDNLLDRLEKQSERLNQMIEDLFQLTLLDENDKRETFELIKLPNVLMDAVLDCQSYADQRGIRITVDDIKQLHILANRQQLKRVFNNLIENAIHYGRDGGYIHITSATDDEYCYIYFKDNGIGIAPEYQQKVFDRFFRVDDARTARTNQGTGIGLNATRHILQLHGGEITLDSTLGVGSTFTVSLPQVKFKPEKTV